MVLHTISLLVHTISWTVLSIFLLVLSMVGHNIRQQVHTLSNNRCIFQWFNTIPCIDYWLVCSIRLGSSKIWMSSTRMFHQDCCIYDNLVPTNRRFCLHKFQRSSEQDRWGVFYWEVTLFSYGSLILWMIHFLDCIYSWLESKRILRFKKIEQISIFLEIRSFFKI